MKKPMNLALLALLGAQLALIAFLYWPGLVNKTMQTGSLLQGLTADSVTGFTITDHSGKSVTLKRVEQDGWLVGSGKSDSCPADPEQVQQLLATLTTLKPDRLVTRTMGSRVRLQVDDQAFAKKLTLQGKGGVMRTLLLGSAPTPRAMHVRLAATDEVYLADHLAAWELDTAPASWWQRRYVQLDRQKLREVSLKNRHGGFTLRREGEKWRFTDGDPQQEPAPEAVEDFLAKVSHLTINRYLGRQYHGKPLDEAVLTLTDDGGEPLTVTAGPAGGTGEDRELVIKSSGTPFYAATECDELEPLLTTERENLMSPPDDQSSEDR